jgi:daunorubicin/doxorubicin transport system ATP-binding protein
MSEDLAIQARSLVKEFRRTRAVDRIDLDVPMGAVYGLLGPNGAGKTTTIRMLATLLRPDGGSASVLGHDIVRDADGVRGRVSLTGQFASVDEDLTGRENLTFLARLYGYRRSQARRRAGELLRAFDLAEAAARTVKTYSGGMRRRLDIAASLVITPDLLFLDEPTTGLDPRSRDHVWQIVRTLAARGTTVLLTTQYLDEADRLADRIAVIDRGRVIAAGTPAELKDSVGSGVLHLRLRDARSRPQAAQLLARVLDAVPHEEVEPTMISIPARDAGRVAHALDEVTRSEIELAAFSLSQPSLDEVFLALTGRPAEPNTEEEAA